MDLFQKVLFFQFALVYPEFLFVLLMDNCIHINTYIEPRGEVLACLGLICQ